MIVYQIAFFTVFQCLLSCFLRYFNILKRLWGPSGPQGPLGSIQSFFEKSIFYDFMDVGRYFAYKRYYNTIIRPWDLSRIVDNGLLYILLEYNIFWTGLMGMPMGSQGGLPWGSQGALWADGPIGLNDPGLKDQGPMGPRPRGPPHFLMDLMKIFKKSA